MSHIDTLIIGAHDVGIAIQNAVVAAESLGLGAVDIGAVRFNSIEIAKELNLPKYVIPMIGLCLGYPDEEPELKPRMPLKAVLFEDKYNTEQAKDGMEEYDEIYKKYLAERKNDPRDGNWSQSISDIYTQLTGSANKEYELLKKQGYIAIKKH